MSDKGFPLPLASEAMDGGHTQVKPDFTASTPAHVNRNENAVQQTDGLKGWPNPSVPVPRVDAGDAAGDSGKGDPKTQVVRG